MDTGLDVLEEWTASAAQNELAAVYGALFAMTDRTLFSTYRVVDDGMELSEFFVMLPEGLVLKVRMHCFDSYGIVYIGPSDRAPGLAGDGSGLPA